MGGQRRLAAPVEAKLERRSGFGRAIAQVDDDDVRPEGKGNSMAGAGNADLQVPRLRISPYRRKSVLGDDPEDPRKIKGYCSPRQPEFVAAGSPSELPVGICGKIDDKTCKVGVIPCLDPGRLCRR